MALKKVSLPELGASESWVTKYKETAIYREHGGREDRDLEYIVLDFGSMLPTRSNVCFAKRMRTGAEFLYQLSSFAGLFQQSRGRTHAASYGDQVRAVVHYLQRYYLPCLAQSGLNIIHTAPIWRLKTSLISVELLTTIHFHVYSASTITRENWSHASGSTEPVIVVL